MNRDAIFVAIFFVVAYVLAVSVEGFELLHEWSREHEDWQADEIITALILLPIALGAYAWARILDVKRHAARRATAEDAQWHAEEDYRQLVMRSPLGIVTCAEDGVLVRANPAFKAMTGSDPEAADVHLLDLYEDEELYREALEELNTSAYLRGHEATWKRGDGETIDVRLSGRKMERQRDDGEVVTSLELTAEDVTEQRTLESQLRQAQKLEAVGRLAGGVAHDFNNLLTVVLTEAALAGNSVAPDSPSASAFHEIETAGKRGAALTRQLLAFSRRELTRPSVFSINDLMSEAEKMLRRLIGEDISLVVRTDPDLRLVSADRGQIEQVLMNLVVNARDAMPVGGHLSIETGNRALDEEYARLHREVEPGEYVVFAVSDSGVGMSREVQDRLFEPFFTTKGLGVGTGLGLATSYGIVKQSGGHIGVYSEEGVGTTMRVYLPRASELEVDEARREDGEQPDGAETILVVEDEAPLRRAVKRILIPLGYTVLEAGDGVEALRMLEAGPERVDLILSDIVLPNMGGRELSDRVWDAWPNAKILFMTGYTDDVIMRQRLARPNVPLLHKPFGPDELARAVRDVVDGRPWEHVAPIEAG